MAVKRDQPNPYTDGHVESHSNGHLPVLRVGIIGCGEISQVAHIPTINFLSHRFRTTYLCDISEHSLQYCAGRVLGEPPKVTRSAKELCTSPNVDVVIIANADAYHVEHGILALRSDKYCMIEKPASLCFRDIDRLIEAEKVSKGRVLVGTMRRYAHAFLDAVHEVGGLDQIIYGRVRDIIGPNSDFVEQSCTYPRRFSDCPEADVRDKARRESDIFEQALTHEFEVPCTPESQSMLQILGGLGTHDLSAMREIFGMPEGVEGAFLQFPGIWSVIFRYKGFPVTYESGITNVPQFDAHIEVYSPNKIVRVDFDTPYVKGLPVTMTIRERIGRASFQERKIRKTYEDPYTLELLEFYDCVINDRQPKTSVCDARKDVELIKMVLRSGFGA